MGHTSQAQQQQLGDQHSHMQEMSFAVMNMQRQMRAILPAQEKHLHLWCHLPMCDCMICVLTKQVAELQRQVQQNQESYKTSLNDLRQQQAAEMHECKQQQAQNTNSPQGGVTGIQGTSEQEVQMTDLPKVRTEADVEIEIEQEVQPTGLADDGSAKGEDRGGC